MHVMLCPLHPCLITMLRQLRDLYYEGKGA